MGDFNINIVNYETNCLIKDLVDTMYSYYAHPMITVPTRVTETTATLIDNIFTNVLGKTMKSGVLSMDIADHCPIFLITFKEQTKQSTTLYHKYKRKINETNRAKFKLKVGKYTWTEILQSLDPQKAFTL